MPLILYKDMAVMEWADIQSAAPNMSHDLIERQLLHRTHVVAGASSVGLRWATIMSLPAILAWLALLAGVELARLLRQSGDLNLRHGLGRGFV